MNFDLLTWPWHFALKPENPQILVSAIVYFQRLLDKRLAWKELPVACGRSEAMSKRDRLTVGYCCKILDLSAKLALIFALF